MGNKNNSLSSYNETKEFTLETFKEEMKRKMTIHILSDNSEDCIDFIELFTNEKVNNANELLEKNIIKKVNLFSFMNYKIYEDANVLADKIIEKVNYANENPKEAIFSEVIVLLHNSNIVTQIMKIKENFQNKKIWKTPYLYPFLIIISPDEKIDLKGFLNSKIFHYKITLKDISYYIKNIQREQQRIEKEKDKKINTKKKNKKKDIKEEKQEKNEEIYYNELGDEILFINSEKKKELIQLEEDTHITVYINILFLGRTGTGKSTLINLILGENKSFERGNGFSATSQNLIVYKKTGIPIRLYDVKGIENESTVDNYLEILTKFNQDNSKSKDDYVIFYCIEYKKGTVIEGIEDKIYEKLVEIKRKIYFIITKTNYDINKEPKDEKTKEVREGRREKIEKAIKDKIKSVCKKCQINGEDFINNYITIDYVNLVRDYEEEPYVPVFGIDKVLSFFSKLYSDKKWDELDNYCKNENDQKCEEYCKENYFLKNYSKFNNINERNEIEANKYLKGLKAGAFFSGMIPGLDIGMEYFYKNKFKERLESLYGFNYDEAKTYCKEDLKREIYELEKKIKDEKEEKEVQKKNIILNEENKSINSPDNENYEFSDKSTTPLKREKNIESKDYEKKLSGMKKEEEEEMDSKNIGKNTASVIRGKLKKLLLEQV